MGEMIFARQLLKGDRKERARLRKAADEAAFGVQFATNNIDEGVGVARLAADAGARWVDLNCGCPIHEATRRGLGSALLRKPEKLRRLVAGIVEGSPLPLSVKVRTAPQGIESLNVYDVVAAVADAGAAAVTIHGRTAVQRYSRAADWGLIGEVAAKHSELLLVGNGDILTHFEARSRLAASGVAAVMVGRGALTKPWIFQEFRDGVAWEPDAAERVSVYRRLACYMREHFGDDERGRRGAFYFLPWHFDFLSRYMPTPEESFAQAAANHPLLQTRFSPVVDDAPPLDWLLAQPTESIHEQIAAALWDAASDDDAVRSLTAIAERERAVAAVRLADDSAEGHPEEQAVENVQG